MKKKFLFISAIVILVACNNKADQPVAEEDTANVQDRFLWQSSLNDSTGKLEMKKIPANDSTSPQAIIDFLNKDNPQIKLLLVKISNDTAYLKIEDANYLTQQMGSTGPSLYLSEVVYNITEIAGVTKVNLDFEEGDHASPGTFNRDSFKNE